MTRTLRDGQSVKIVKRHGRYIVTSRGHLVENTWQLSWALYRFRCCM